jgi:hypothetical protein
VKRASRIFSVIAVATMVIATPRDIKLDAKSGLSFTKTVALAQGSNSGPGGGNSGPGGGNSGPGGGSSGPGGNDHSSGSGTQGGADELGSPEERSLKNGTRLGRHGERIEIRGDRIAVSYSDGFKEEIANGALKLMDPAGRTVIRRPITAGDWRRLRSLAGW